MHSRMVWRLQSSCKCIPERFGACRTPANAFPNGLVLAELLQTHSRTVLRLQSSCKCIPERFCACRASASVKTFIFTFAERRYVFGMVGAVPVCPPECPRSGVSIPKYICASRIMDEDLTMDAPLQGDTGGHTGAAPTKLHHTFLHHSIKRHHPSTCNPPIINGHVPAKPSII